MFAALIQIQEWFISKCCTTLVYVWGRWCAQFKSDLLGEHVSLLWGSYCGKCVCVWFECMVFRIRLVLWVWALTVVTAVYSINHLVDGTAEWNGWRLSFASQGKMEQINRPLPRRWPRKWGWHCRVRSASLLTSLTLPLFLSLYSSYKRRKPQSQHPLHLPRGKDHYDSGFVTARRQGRAHLCLNMDGFAQLYEIMCLSEQVGHVCWVGRVESLRTSSLLGFAHVGESFSLRVISQRPKCLVSNYMCSESAQTQTVLLISHGWTWVTQEPVQNIVARRSKLLRKYTNISKMS